MGIVEIRGFGEAKKGRLSGKCEKAREYGRLVRGGVPVLVGVFIFSIFMLNNLLFMSAQI